MPYKKRPQKGRFFIYRRLTSGKVTPLLKVSVCSLMI